ncbi:hypothetical protein NZL82_15445 [Sphingomonas sanguinis]|uniref:hypothetical protein n=1 Tax=Sphingomonas sp. LC-1 TaxID=3110957 RepID=UPI0021BA85D7|nr:hypothetical protein [Sphingomonas sp. LC-1]MCT8003270.1 hypothetical protein [Sphingomonas sp. LC-1]
MLSLVQKHSRSTVDSVLRKRDPNDVPSWNAIGHARRQFLTANPSARRMVGRSAKAVAERVSVATPIRQPVCNRAPLTFEEKLARVAAGARLITVYPLRKPAPPFTLGGVGSSTL